MEQLLNQLPQDNPRHIGWRGIALIVIGLLAAVGFLMYAGGFNVVARIFGSKAGIDSQFLLAGVTNLENRQGAADWLVPDTSAALDGTGTFTSATGVTDFMVPNSIEAGFIMPLITSTEAGQDAFINHRYASAPMNFRQTGVMTNTIKIYAHLPQDAQVTFGYKTDDDVANLSDAELHSLTPTFSVLPENENVSMAEINLERELKQYLQMTVSFDKFDVTNRAVVYGWIIDYGQTVTSASTTVTTDTKAKVTLAYSGGPAIPTDAKISLLGSELALNPMYVKEHVDLSRMSEYTIDLALTAGAYTIVATSPTTRDRIVPFLVEAGDEQINVNLEAFESAATRPEFTSADLNGDGKINAMDAQLLFEQYGEKP